MKVIVTGGTGFIGSHTVVELIDAGYNPVIVDNLSNSDKSVLDGIKRITGQSVPFVELDLVDKVTTDAFFANHNDAVGVKHFAALKAVGESVKEPLKYYKNNIISLINVIDGMRDQHIPYQIFSSSCTVYGQPEVLPVTEQSKVQLASSPYGNTKQIAEEILCEDILSRHDEDAVIALRYFNPIGAHSSAEIGELPIGVPSNLMPFITQTAAGIRAELSVFGNDYDTKDGTAVRDYIHVVDIAKAHVVALDRLIANKNKSKYEVFNLGTGKGSTVLEVIESFERTTGQKLNYKIAGRRPGDIASTYADTTLAKVELGWATQLTLDHMTSSAWKWQLRLANK